MVRHARWVILPAMVVGTVNADLSPRYSSQTRVSEMNSTTECVSSDEKRYLLHGPPGSGKTTLGQCCSNAAPL